VPLLSRNPPSRKAVVSCKIRLAGMVPASCNRRLHLSVDNSRYDIVHMMEPLMWPADWQHVVGATHGLTILFQDKRYRIRSLTLSRIRGNFTLNLHG
jgi:hypothetical protein